MIPVLPDSPRRRAFTLVELLVAISIIAVLAAILLPAINAVRKAHAIAATESLLQRLEVALNAYQQEMSVFPPDFITGPPTKVRALTEVYADTAVPAAGLLPPEALCYYLTNGFLREQGALLIVSKGRETMDCNGNGFPEIIDAWGRPILYNRRAFPSGGSFNYIDTGITPNVLSGPYHNPETYDLYSVGPDGTTGTDTTADKFPRDVGPNLLLFCRKAMNENIDGDGADDIKNWKQ